MRRAARAGQALDLGSATALLSALGRLVGGGWSAAHGGDGHFVGAAVTSSLLVFSEAEIQFLFPAPVSRHSSASPHDAVAARHPVRVVIFSIFMRRLRIHTPPDGIAMWLCSRREIYFAGISLARTRLVAAALSARRGAWTPVCADRGVGDRRRVAGTRIPRRPSRAPRTR